MANTDKSQPHVRSQSDLEEKITGRAFEDRTGLDAVDLASEASFPASDPPSWTPLTGTGLPRLDRPTTPTKPPKRALSSPRNRTAATRARQEDDALVAAKSRLEAALATVPPPAEHEGNEAFLAAVRALHEALASHVTTAEGPNGLMSQIDRTRQTLVRGVDRMHDEHGDLLQYAAGLREQVERLSPEPRPISDEIRTAASQLLEGLRDHQAREDDLIYESSFTDIGVGD
jgi:hypothetical protein